MRSQLTRSVFRQLLSNEGLVFHGPAHTASLTRRCIRHGISSPVRVSPRRNFWGIATKPPREPKEPSVDPGLGIMSEVTFSMRNGARLPPAGEMEKAWRSFVKHKRTTKDALNRLQAQHVLNTFKCLKSIESDPSSTGLRAEDLSLGLKALTMEPEDQTDLHNELAKLLYAELTQMESISERAKFNNLLAYAEVLCKTGDAIEARDLALAYCKNQAEIGMRADLIIENSKYDLGRLWKLVLDGFKLERNSMELTNTFEMAESYGLQYDSEIHNLMTKHFADQDDIEATKLWFSKPMASSNATSLGPALSIILPFCIRNNENEWCTSVFKDILSTNPDKPTWDIILQWAAGVMGKGVEDVEHMMEVMVRRNPNDELCRPNVKTINGLVSMAMSLKDPYLAERYINLGLKWGIKPNSATYIYQISYRTAANDLTGAQSAYEALQAEEVYNDKDQPAINEYIRALCNAKNINYNLITSITSDLEERKKRLEADTVTALSLMYLRRQEIDQVIDLLQTNCWHYTIHERARIRDAFVAYCLDGYNSTAKAWDAYTIFRQLFDETGIDIRTQMMNEFFRRRRSDMACHVFGHMRQHSNPNLRPVLETYVQCFEGIAKYKDREHLDMVHNMLKLDSKIEPNTRLYNALMLAYTACDDADRALIFWNDITTSIEGPSYNSLDIVFWACSQKPFGEIKAREIWGKIKRMQVEVTKEVFASYLGAIASAGLWEESKALVDGMGKEFGFKMDVFILGSLYNSLANQNRRDICEKWAEEHHPVVMAELKKFGRVKNRDTGERFFQLKIERKA